MPCFTLKPVQTSGLPKPEQKDEEDRNELLFTCDKDASPLLSGSAAF